jgi:hypothetical protein
LLVLYDDERVVFDENTEKLVVDGAVGDDRIVMFASSAGSTDAFGGAGKDTFVINSTTNSEMTNLFAGTGNDVFLLVKTTADTHINLRGEDGNDTFLFGSNQTDDNGNIGTIRGAVSIFAGANSGGEDRMFVNDHGATAAYSYRITPTSLTAIPGPANAPRPLFAGIVYDGTLEFARFDGTAFPNLFEVVPSLTTRIYIDGNSPVFGAANRDILSVATTAGDGSQLTITNVQLGQGYVTFTNGNETVQFENIELAYRDFGSQGYHGGSGNNGASSMIVSPYRAGSIQDRLYRELSLWLRGHESFELDEFLTEFDFDLFSSIEMEFSDILDDVFAMNFEV